MLTQVMHDVACLFEVACVSEPNTADTEVRHWKALLAQATINIPRINLSCQKHSFTHVVLPPTSISAALPDCTRPTVLSQCPSHFKLISAHRHATMQLHVALVSRSSKQLTSDKSPLGALLT